MKNNRNLFILIGVLVVLGGIYALTGDRRPALDTTGGFVDLVEGQLSTDDVHGVVVSRGTGEESNLEIVQRGGSWVVASHHDAPASINKVRTLLGNLESVEGELRSDDASVLDAYALDDSSAYRLSVRDESGGALASLLVGKRSGNGCFVRKPGSNEVYLTDHNFLSDLGVWGDDRGEVPANPWIDLVAFQVERDDVRRVELRADEVVVMAKEFQEPEAEESGVDAPAEEEPVQDGATPAVPDVEPAVDPQAYEWRVTSPENFVAARSRADGVLNSLASLRARDVVGRGGDRDEYGLGDDADRVVIALADGSEHTLLFGASLPEDDSQFYFQEQGDDLVWSMPSYVRSNVFKSAEDMRVQ